MIKEHLEKGYFSALDEISKTLKNEFQIKDADRLALSLCDMQIYELTDDMKKIIAYIKDNVIDVEEKGLCLSMFLDKENVDDLKKKKYLYEQYRPETRGKKKENFNCFQIDPKKIDEYKQIFAEKGFSDNEVFTIISQIVDMVVKDPKDIQKTLKLLDVFEMSEEDYKRFVLDNVFYLFRDFARKLDRCFSDLIQQYGKEKAIEMLRKNPDIMYSCEN